VQLARAAGTAQRAIAYKENDGDLPPPPLIDLARGSTTVRRQRRLWMRFQMVSTLPEKDRRAVIRLVNSLASLRAKTPQLALWVESAARLGDIEACLPFWTSPFAFAQLQLLTSCKCQLPSRIRGLPIPCRSGSGVALQARETVEATCMPAQ